MRRLALLCAFFAFNAEASAQKVPEEEVKEGFISMFNGKDFSGWTFNKSYALPEKLPNNWKVEDGVIRLSGGGSPHCGSQWDYEDFDVRFDWRANKDKYNSGFYIRSGRPVGSNQINLAKGDEGHFIGGKIKGDKKVPDLQNKFGEWNEWRVLVIGDKVTFWCNGKPAWEGTEFQSKRGWIGLQAEGAPVDFRNLRIKELGYDNLNDLKQWAAVDGWKMEGDTIAGAAKAKPLISAKADFKDYVLRLEWKADKGAVGGIAVRGDKSGKAVVNIGDLADGSGGIAAGKPSKKADNPLGQWNYLEIAVTGNKGRVWLNGEVVADKIDLAAAGAADSAGISLQLNEQPLQFRNIRLKQPKG